MKEQTREKYCILGTNTTFLNTTEIPFEGTITCCNNQSAISVCPISDHLRLNSWHSGLSTLHEVHYFHLSNNQWKHIELWFGFYEKQLHITLFNAELVVLYYIQRSN